MKVFKINKQKEVGIVVVYLDRKVTDKEHENLLKLAEKSDLAFVFPDSQKHKISVKKFSHLYSAVFYGQGDSNDEMTEIWKMLDYLHELTDYYCYSLVLQEDLGNLEGKDIQSIERLQNSILEISVYSWRSLTNEELQKLYTIPRRTLRFLRYTWTFRGNLGNSGMYAKYKTEDKVLFIRPISITTLKDDLRREHGPEILATFKGSGIKLMLPSLISKTTNINLDINHAKI